MEREGTEEAGDGARMGKFSSKDVLLFFVWVYVCNFSHANNHAFEIIKTN